MSHASIEITTPDWVTLQTKYGANISDALAVATRSARALVDAHSPDLFLRDCLGGLRAEVRWRDHKITVVRTR